jgi:hypothetical protein
VNSTRNDFPQQNQQARNQGNNALSTYFSSNYRNMNSQARNGINSPHDLLLGFPFANVRSPFSGSVNRHPFNHTFGEFFTDFSFIQPSEEFFRDNYASNFSSNFADPLIRIIFIRTINPYEQQNRGASPQNA